MDDEQHQPRWVDRLFARLHVRYGDAWLRKWEGLPMEAVKADWQAMLGTLYARCPESLVYALDRLPADFPPNSDAFLRLAMGYTAPAQRLPAPAQKADPTVMSAVRAALDRSRPDPGRECAERLRDRARHGQLSAPQKAQLAALEAIGK